MNPKFKVFRSGDLVAEVQAESGESILSALSSNKIFLDAPCGGRGACGKCKVRLSPDGEEVKACQTTAEDGLTVYLPAKMDMEIAGQTATRSMSSLDGDFGVAIDIGTTTVVAHLTHLETGERVATQSGVNAQRPYGADVVSRIEYTMDHGPDAMTQLIQAQINTLITGACRDAGVSPKRVTYISIAGNTIMQHLAAGYSPAGMGTVPFEPVSMFGGELPVWDGLPTSENTKIYYAPCISSYVGGDITAGLLACDLEGDDGPIVFIDIGTNGEIAAKIGDKYLCCATAAGPAFEGAELSHGMAAISGAISHVRWDKDDLVLTVIGATKPEGLCGSGLLDTLAMLLGTGAVDETGRLLNTDEFDHPIGKYIGEYEGKNAFFLSDNVCLTAADIRKIQLAKAAIAAGINTLLITENIKPEAVKTFILAGGFGSYLDRNSAARIGLFPSAFLPVTKGMGNTAGEGAALALIDPKNRELLESIRERCSYIELSDSLIFNEEFVEQMMFEE